MLEHNEQWEGHCHPKTKVTGWSPEARVTWDNTRREWSDTVSLNDRADVSTKNNNIVIHMCVCMWTIKIDLIEMDWIFLFFIIWLKWSSQTGAHAQWQESHTIWIHRHRQVYTECENDQIFWGSTGRTSQGQCLSRDTHSHIKMGQTLEHRFHVDTA